MNGRVGKSVSSIRNDQQETSKKEQVHGARDPNQVTKGRLSLLSRKESEESCLQSWDNRSAGVNSDLKMESAH